MRSNATVDQALRDLSDAREDLYRGGFSDGQGGIRRLVAVLDAAPLGTLIRAHLPPFDFQSWWEKGRDTSRSMTGSGRLEWPIEFGERLAAQIAFCRAAAQEKGVIQDYMYRFLRSGDLDQRFHELLSRVVDPLVRDVERLSELRVPPPALEALIGSRLPPSGDDRLDELLQEAREKFRDPSPTVRQDALERLWDAWERLKTLIKPTDKRRSVGELLNLAATESGFRKTLESEATALTEIGNSFQIRHFETNKTPLSGPDHVDFLFHRCFALVWLLLRALERSGPR